MVKNLGLVASAGVVGISALALLSSSVSAQVNNTDLNFFERLANKLGVSTEKLTEASKEAQYEIVDEKVVDGELDEDRAAEIKERIEAGNGMMFGGHGFGMGGRGMGPGKNPELVADFLGVSVAEISALRDDGMTVQEIIEKYGKSEDDFHTYMEEKMPFDARKVELLAGFLGVDESEIDSLKDTMTSKEIIEKYGKTLEDFRTYMQENRPEGRGFGMGRFGGQQDQNGINES